MAIAGVPGSGSKPVRRTSSGMTPSTDEICTDEVTYVQSTLSPSGQPSSAGNAQSNPPLSSTNRDCRMCVP